MRKITIAAASAAAAAAVTLPLAASAAPVPYRRPAVCRVLARAVSDGRLSLRQEARALSGTPGQVALLTGFCSDPQRVPWAFVRYVSRGDWSAPVPAGVRLYGPL